MDLIKYPKANFEKNKLLIDETITIDEWRELGRSLRQVEGALLFWLSDWMKFGEEHGFIKHGVKSAFYDELEDITGFERGTLMNIKSTGERVESSRRHEDLSFGHHTEVAKLIPEKQKYFLEKASEEKLSVRELREEVRRDEIITNEAELPSDKYRIIYADPPWKYGNSMPSYFSEQANHYTLMTVDEICQMPVNELSQDDAVLFLWVTSPILEESFRVVRAWGFEYKTSFIWDKIKHNMGHYNSVRHELLLVCVKGSCPPDVPKLFDSVLNIERTEHSKKPEEFRNIIDTIYPNGKRIELFARTKIENWETYGNQLS